MPGWRCVSGTRTTRPSTSSVRGRAFSRRSSTAPHASPDRSHSERIPGESIPRQAGRDDWCTQMVMLPWKPSARRVIAARAAACPAPTMRMFALTDTGVLVRHCQRHVRQHAYDNRVQERTCASDQTLHPGANPSAVTFSEPKLHVSLRAQKPFVQSPQRGWPAPTGASQPIRPSVARA
jgi:hypothetical protein